MTSRELMATARHVSASKGIPLEEALGNIVPRLNDDRAKLIRQTHAPDSKRPGLYYLRTPDTLPPSVLIELDAGLGDSIAMSIILRHLQKYRPDWPIDIWVRPGFESIGNGLCRLAFSGDKPRLDQYTRIYRLDFYAYDWLPYADSPSTPVMGCLRETFGIKPDPELLRYKINFQPLTLSNEFGWNEYGCKTLDNGKLNLVVVHYQSDGGEPQNKNLKLKQIEPLLQSLDQWSYRHFLLFPKRLDTLINLISQASLFIGIDSGPLHVAGATNTPSIGVWTKHHPLAYFDLCPNVTHLVPRDFGTMWPFTDEDNRMKALLYFADHYAFCGYSDDAELPSRLVDLAKEILKP